MTRAENAIGESEAPSRFRFLRTAQQRKFPSPLTALA
jgi:hypothetical protein